MRFWLISFGLLFAAAKLLAWFQQFQLPLSAFVAGGVALAIASNYDKRNVFPFWPTQTPEAIAPEPELPPFNQ
ncbi:MAG: hypothetical protein HC771_17020 [Synechococcales cyanobacterium CRU_2_2]|nr:hypothetical protein [Synechococcales cyanobacterium CRU_2_2]